MGLRPRCCCCLDCRKAASLERFDDRGSHVMPFASQRLQQGNSKQISLIVKLGGQLKHTTRLHLAFAFAQAVQAMFRGWKSFVSTSKAASS